MNATLPLDAEIRRRIRSVGPMPLAQYMSLCLTHPQHGYYINRDPIGAGGDFTTAPEISQMFGELIGLWSAATWRHMDSPDNVRLIELGPGRGTMMADAVRAANVLAEFSAALVLHLVEISPALRQRQRETLADIELPMHWHERLDEVPEGTSIILANEFFDALPVHQAIKQLDGWHERVVAIDGNGSLAMKQSPEPMRNFDRLLPKAVREAPFNSIYEWRNLSIAMEIGRRLAHHGGAALIIDYGHARSAPGDTLQAVGGHAFADPLGAPGLVDLTAHVDFEALGLAAESMGARVHGPLEQGEFLRRLGIEARAAALKEQLPRDRRVEIDAALARLIGTGSQGMGKLFKVMALSAPALETLPGFDD